MSIVNRSAIKNLVGDFKTSNEFYPRLDREVEEMIKKAMARAKENQRRTLMARDL